MMQLRPWALFVCLLSLSAVLAGCLGDEPQPAGASPPPTSDATGAVQGRVLTTELEPVSNAQVGLTQGDALVAETRTDADGAYLLGDLTPGAYRLQVTAMCCRATLRPVDVVAGEAVTADLQLTPYTSDDLQIPYTVQDQWEGFVSCGLSTVAVQAALCSITEGTPVADPNEEFMRSFTVGRGLKTLVVGMQWDSVGGVSGEKFNLVVEEGVCEELGCTDAYLFADETGSSPIIVRLDNDDIADPAFAWDNITDTFPMQYRIFVGGDATVAYQQPFRVYWHEFYWAEAPEDFSPIPDA